MFLDVSLYVSPPCLNASNLLTEAVQAPACGPQSLIVAQHRHCRRGCDRHRCLAQCAQLAGGPSPCLKGEHTVLLCQNHHGAELGSRTCVLRARSQLLHNACMLPHTSVHILERMPGAPCSCCTHPVLC